MLLLLLLAKCAREVLLWGGGCGQWPMVTCQQQGPHLVHPRSSRAKIELLDIPAKL